MTEGHTGNPTHAHAPKLSPLNPLKPQLWAVMAHPAITSVDLEVPGRQDSNMPM